MIRVGGQTEIVNLSHSRVTVKITCYLYCITAMALHTHIKRTHTLYQQESIKRVAVTPQQAVPLGHVGVHFLHIPARQRPPDSRTVPVQELGSAVKHIVRPIRKRLLQPGGGKCIIHRNDKVVLAAQFSEGLNIHTLYGRVGRRFQVHHTDRRVGLKGRFGNIQVAQVGNAGADTQRG